MQSEQDKLAVEVTVPIAAIPVEPVVEAEVSVLEELSMIEKLFQGFQDAYKIHLALCEPGSDEEIENRFLEATWPQMSNGLSEEDAVFFSLGKIFSFELIKEILEAYPEAEYEVMGRPMPALTGINPKLAMPIDAQYSRFAMLLVRLHEGDANMMGITTGPAGVVSVTKELTEEEKQQAKLKLAEALEKEAVILSKMQDLLLAAEVTAADVLEAAKKEATKASASVAAAKRAMQGIVLTTEADPLIPQMVELLSGHTIVYKSTGSESFDVSREGLATSAEGLISMQDKRAVMACITTARDNTKVKLESLLNYLERHKSEIHKKIDAVLMSMAEKTKKTVLDGVGKPSNKLAKTASTSSSQPQAAGSASSASLAGGSTLFPAVTGDAAKSASTLKP